MKAEQAIRQDREFIAQVTRALPRLSTQARQGWIEDPKGLASVLAKALNSVPDFQIWARGTFGGRTDSTVRRIPTFLADEGVEVSDRALNLIQGIPHIPPSTTDRCEELVKVSIQDLGLGVVATTTEVYKRALRYKLEPCPIQVVLELCMRFPSLRQPEGERFCIASYLGRLALDLDPVEKWDVLRFSNDKGGRRLSTRNASPDRQWTSRDEWIFAKSRI